MFAWISSNIADIVIIAILTLVVIFAGRYVYREKQKGGCVGCPSKTKDGGCSSCNSKQD